MKNKTIAVIIADEGEYEPFLKKVTEAFGAKTLSFFSMRACEFSLGGDTVFAVEAGNGKVRAAACAAYVIAEKKPDAIFNAGYSGAVCGVRRGECLVGSEHYECDFDLTALGYALGEKPGKRFFSSADSRLIELAASTGIRAMKLGTGDMFLTSNEKKRLFADKFGIAAFDMESSALASVCEDAKIPFLSIRKISDDCEETAKTDYREMNARCEGELSDILISLVKEYSAK